MRRLSASYDAAVAAIDAANAADPNHVTVRGTTQPLALAHGHLAAEWVAHLVDDPAEALLLAARAHHLRRWEVPRGTYPEGKAGYLRWRRDQKLRHATEVEAILADSGYDAATIARTQELIRRDHLATDADTQVLEDAACLVFLETQLADVEARLEHDHLLDVIRKTARKMSPAGLAAVGEMGLGEHAHALLAEALTAPAGADIAPDTGPISSS
ncbi:MAG: hypothetical protein JWN62_2429 [Acidimicrobiales bacterium]|jgi:hypothetical protein|nr:hypothetical protein [Acidimicrobiales bacterium]